MNENSENPAPGNVPRIFTFTCPRCGAEILTNSDCVGNAATCECGQQYRVNLVIQKLPIENDSVWRRGQRVSVKFWKWCAVTWQQSIWPRSLAFSRYLRDKWFPAAVNTTKAVCRNVAKGFKTIFATPNSTAAKQTMSNAERPVAVALIPTPAETRDDEINSVLDNVTDDATAVGDFFSLTSAPSVSGQSISQSTSESDKLYRLANQMMVAGLYNDAYAYASQAVVLDPSNVSAWTTKGVAAAYSSTPPNFRLNEIQMCLRDLRKTDMFREFLPSLQKHLIQASSNYRKLLRQACRDADDDAQREPLAADVDIGLQLTLRNRRVARVQTQKHSDGYFASIECIRYAAGLNPTFHALTLGLSEIDAVLSNENFPGFVNFLSEEGKREQLVRLREDFVMQIRKIRPSFTPPEAPRASGCFIATAAAGNEFDPSVCTLRRFREQILLPTVLGRKCVSLYYRLSPPLAAAIRQTPWQQRLVLAVVVRPLSMAAEYVMCKRRSTKPDRDRDISERRIDAAQCGLEDAGDRC